MQFQILEFANNFFNINSGKIKKKNGDLLSCYTRDILEIVLLAIIVSNSEYPFQF